MTVVRLVVVLSDDDTTRRTPADLREYFLDEIRAAILRAEGDGRLDSEIAAELWRALPERSPRR
jgi:hypothetical protein